MNAEWNHPSITELPEDAFIKALLRSPYYRHNLLSVKDMDLASHAYLSLPRPFMRGDIDILLVPEGRPGEAIAIEVKRLVVRVPPEDVEYAPLNKVQELKKGRKQAERSFGQGFSQSYLWVFTQIDSRPRSQGREVSYEGEWPQQRQELEAALSGVRPAAGVGYMTHTFVQSMDDHFLGAGSSHFSYRAAPAIQEQPPNLTGWVEKVAKTLRPFR